MASRSSAVAKADATRRAGGGKFFGAKSIKSAKFAPKNPYSKIKVGGPVKRFAIKAWKPTAAPKPPSVKQKTAQLLAGLRSGSKIKARQMSMASSVNALNTRMR